MEPKEIYRSLIRLHILLEAARGQIDISGVVGKLHDRGLTANLASVRQSLRTLKSRGYLVSNEVRNSRARTMYSITPAGRLRARDAKKKISKRGRERPLEQRSSGGNGEVEMVWDAGYSVRSIFDYDRR